MPWAESSGGGDSGQLVTMGSRGRVSFFFQELLVFCVMISALLCKKKKHLPKMDFPRQESRNQGPTKENRVEFRGDKSMFTRWLKAKAKGEKQNR